MDDFLLSKIVQNSDIPTLTHFDTFWFFSHNLQTNQPILSLKVSKGYKILQQLYAERKFEKKINLLTHTIQLHIGPGP